MRKLTTLLAVLLLPACGGGPIAPDDTEGPSFDVVSKSVMCHRTTEGTYIRIVIAGTAVPAHRDHGDAGPGEAVPGPPGMEFTETCDVIPTTVFAIAYTDMDPDDGPGFKEGTDVLIAKLIDYNDGSPDGLIGQGDRVILGRYPMDFGVAAFGDYGGVTVHRVTSVVTEWCSTPPSGECAVTVGVENGTVFAWQDAPYRDQYVEAFDGRGIVAMRDASWGLETDRIRADTGWGVHGSQPLQEASAERTLHSDEGFLDVDINIVGL